MRQTPALYILQHEYASAFGMILQHWSNRDSLNLSAMASLTKNN